MVKIATRGTDPDKSGGGDYIDQEGNFHFSVEGARDNSNAEKPCIEFDFSVLGSTANGQEGRKHKEKFFLVGADDAKTAACHNRLLKFLCAVGLYDETKWRAATASGNAPDLDFDPESVVGMQFCAPVTLKPGTTNPNMKFSNLGFTFWAVGDEEADGIPKNAEWLAIVMKDGCLPTRKGEFRKPGNGGSGQAAKPNATKPTASKPAAKTPPADTVDPDDIF